MIEEKKKSIKRGIRIDLLKMEEHVENAIKHTKAELIKISERMVKEEETKENEGVEEGLISAHNPIQEAETTIMKKRKDREVLAKAVLKGLSHQIRFA
jgi:hypothetical protein